MQYPNIAQPQYAFAPTVNFDKGGLASLSLPSLSLPSLSTELNEAAQSGLTSLGTALSSATGVNMMSPNMAQIGVGMQNIGNTLSQVPTPTSQILGFVASNVGNAMMGSQVSPVANPADISTTAISPNQEAVAALANLIAQEEAEESENAAVTATAVANANAQADAEATEAASAMAMSPGFATDTSGDAATTASSVGPDGSDGMGGFTSAGGEGPSGPGNAAGTAGVGHGEKEGGLISIKKYAEGGMTMSPQYGFAPTMPSMSDMPLGMTNQNMFSGMEGQNMPPSMMDQNMFPGVMGQNMFPGMMDQNMSGMMGQNMPQMNFKKGGLASLSLPEMAQRVQNAGRDGDTVLAHITPEEAGILQLLGGSGTINPKTGQPEFKYLKKIIPKEIYKPLSSLGKEIERGVEKIAKDPILGPIAQIAAGAFGGPIGAALYAGLAPEGSSFNTKRALTAAALTAGANYIANPGGNPLTPAYGPFSGGAAGVSAAGTGGPYDISDVGSMGDLGMANTGTTPYLPSPTDVAAAQAATAPSSLVDAVAPPLPPAPAAPAAPPAQITSGSTPIQPLPGEGSVFDFSRAGAPAPNVVLSPIASTPAAATSAASGVGGLAGAAGETALGYVKNMSIKDMAQTVFAGTQIKAAMEAKKELDKQKEEAEKVLAAQEKHTQEEIAFAEDVMRKYPVEYRRLTAEDVRSQNLAGGGLAGLNAFKAGGIPRFLKGDGDGMSDDIPAMIGRQQKAALSDGEFVVPADVVSHLGNGSSNAGAKKLYSMMDNIRQARTGKERQAPEVKSDRYMPA